MRHLILLAALLAGPRATAQIRFEAAAGPVVSQLESFEFNATRSFGSIVRVVAEPEIGTGFDVGGAVTAGSESVQVRLGVGYLQTENDYATTTLRGPVLASDTLAKSLSLRRARVRIDVLYAIPLDAVEPYVLVGAEGRYTLDIGGEGVFGQTDDVVDQRWSSAVSIGGGARFKAFGVRLGPEVRYVRDIGGIGATFVTATTAVKPDPGFRIHTVVAALVVQFSGGPRVRR